MAFLSGASRVLVGAGCLLVATSAHAYEVKKTTTGALVHWEQSSVAYSVDPSVDSAVPGGSTATINAMKGWSGEVGAPSMEGSLAGPDAPTAPGLDHKNGVFYVAGGYAPAGKALAITVLTYDNDTGKIMDADVVFNGAYAFAVLPSRAATTPVQLVTTQATGDSATEGDAPAAVQVRGTSSTYDLEHVVAHELGHSLGMNDELVKSTSLMYRYSAPNDATVRSPSSDDVDGLSELYAKSATASGEGCGGATISPKKPSTDAARIATLLVAGLMLFVLLRARRRPAAFAVAAAAAVALLAPRLEGKAARAATAAPGHARAKVVAASTTETHGLFRTAYQLSTTTCRASACPSAGHGETWGGTRGHLRQEVNGAYAPAPGDDVDVAFDGLDPLARLKPLATLAIARDATVRAVTRAF